MLKRTLRPILFLHASYCSTQRHAQELRLSHSEEHMHLAALPEEEMHDEAVCFDFG